MIWSLSQLETILCGILDYSISYSSNKSCLAIRVSLPSAELKPMWSESGFSSILYRYKIQNYFPSKNNNNLM